MKLDQATEEVSQQVVKKLTIAPVHAAENEVAAEEAEEARDDVDARDARASSIVEASDKNENANALDDIEASRSFPILSPRNVAEQQPPSFQRLSSEIVSARSKSDEAIGEDEEENEAVAEEEGEVLDNVDDNDEQKEEAISPACRAAASPSTKLQEMMLERIESIDIIRSLIDQELEQDSALIAEFTEKVVELELELSAKEEEISSLKSTQTQMQHQIAALATQTSNKSAEFAALTAQISALSSQNASLESQNREINASSLHLAPLKARNEQMEQIIYSITASLKDAKTCLEKEMKYTAALEKEKATFASRIKTLGEDRRYEADSWRNRLESENTLNAELRKEVDGLRKKLCEEQLANTKLCSIKAELAAAEESIARLSAEKNGLVEEVSKAKKVNEVLKERMEGEGIEVDPVRILKRELEGLREKLALGEAEMENTQRMGLQAQLEETERLLATLSSSKQALRTALGDVDQSEDNLTFEIKETSSGDSQAVDWIVEKKAMERRLCESDKALVLLAKENEELMAKIGFVEKENADLKTSKESASRREGKEVKLSLELSTLKLSFYKEKKKMMARQQELEGLLIEALKTRYGGESNEVILKKLGEAQLEVVRGASKKKVAE